MTDRIFNSVAGWWGQLTHRKGWSEFVSKRTWVSMQIACIPVLAGMVWLVLHAAWPMVKDVARLPHTLLVSLFLGAAYALPNHHRWDDDQSSLVRRRR